MQQQQWLELLLLQPLFMARKRLQQPYLPCPRLEQGQSQGQEVSSSGEGNRNRQWDSQEQGPGGGKEAGRRVRMLGG